MTIIRMLLRADGSHDDLPTSTGLDYVRVLFGSSLLRVVTLRHLDPSRHTMFFDDRVGSDELPVNVHATELMQTEWRAYPASYLSATALTQVRGDAVVLPEHGVKEMATAALPVRRLIRADGSQQDLPWPMTMACLIALIGAKKVDTVNLRHMGSPPHVMLVDDAGYETKVIEHDNEPPGVRHIELKPVRARKLLNAEATRLYHYNCHPSTAHQIVGDVVVVPDSDFAEGDAP